MPIAVIAKTDAKHEPASPFARSIENQIRWPGNADAGSVGPADQYEIRLPLRIPRHVPLQAANDCGKFPAVVSLIDAAVIGRV